MAYTDITSIPGVESSIAEEFAKIEIYTIEDLKNQDPDRLYNVLLSTNQYKKQQTNPYLLYVFRMAVYFANGGRAQDKLVWSAWRD